MAKVKETTKRALRQEAIAWAFAQQKKTGKFPTKAEMRAHIGPAALAAGIDPATITMLIQLIMQIIQMIWKPKPKPAPVV